MKVRIGVGVGAVPYADHEEFAGLVDDLDELGFDSIWMPEILTAPTVDPLVSLAFAAAHNSRLKLGTTLLLPGRNPVRLGKALATLDVLARGRLLVTFVPGITRLPEPDVIGVHSGDRGALMDEMLPLMRRLWTGEPISHRGRSAVFDRVSVAPLPMQQPLEFWTGGMAPAALRRCGRYADGWLPSACTPDEAAKGRSVIDREAHEVGRSISPEHFGVSIGYAHHPLSEKARLSIARSRRGADPAAVVPIGMDGLRQHLEQFLEVGFSKFVVRPIEVPRSWRAELELLAHGIGDLQT